MPSVVTVVLVSILVADLLWWGRATRVARSQGQLMPGTWRRRAAVAALSADA